MASRTIWKFPLEGVRQPINKWIRALREIGVVP